jgi:hypothetical protein
LNPERLSRFAYLARAIPRGAHRILVEPPGPLNSVSRLITDPAALPRRPPVDLAENYELEQSPDRPPPQS